MKELIRIFEKRRSNLVDLLEKQRDTMDAAEQHQVYGAVNEIDLFLRTMQHYYDEKADDKEIIRHAVTNEPNLLDKWKQKLRDMLE
ncbi:hypothetical protein JW968_02245 [Candidatus Woesearchaeota archaeon]|nr:hypothetical protein [Candidatus Woesearchaeota archaeon]